jgi:hypothetical protein
MLFAEKEGLASLIPEEDPTKQFKARFQRFFSFMQAFPNASTFPDLHK